MTTEEARAIGRKEVSLVMDGENEVIVIVLEVSTNRILLPEEAARGLGLALLEQAAMLQVIRFMKEDEKKRLSTQ